MPTISQLPAATQVNSADLLPIVQVGVTKKATFSLVTAQVAQGITITESQVTGLTADLAARLLKADNLSDLPSAATARTNLGLGSAALLNVPITVPNGGTGDTSFNAYSVICGGTTSAGALQNVSGLGNSGQVLTSNGAGALPTWQNAGAGGVTSTNIQNQTFTYAVASGTPNAIVLAFTPVVAAYVDGQRFSFKATNTNSGATTVDAGAGAVALVTNGNLPLAGNEILFDGDYTIQYNSTYAAFVLLRSDPLIESFQVSSVLLSGATNPNDPLDVVTSGASGTGLISNGLGFAPTFQPVVQPSTLVHSTYTYAIDTGAVNAYAATYTGFVSIADGGVLSFRAANTNTGASTFNPSGSGAAGIVLNTGKTLVGGEIVAGGDYFMQRSVHFGGYILLNPTTVPMTKTLLTSGSGTYTTPSGCTRLRIRIVGAGGAGGGAATGAAAGAAGAGGGGGAYVEHFINSPAATYAYAVGAGGIPGAAGNNPGGNGGDTTFGGILTATGGTGGGGSAAGASVVSGTGGTGGTATGGNVINCTGGNGFAGITISATLTSPGNSGGSVLGQGTSTPTNGTAAGSTGGNIGVGGSGGAQVNGGLAQSGGAGSNGAVIIEEFYT